MNHGYPDYNIENINEIPPKIKNKLNEIAFSQLLSFITNLNDFEIKIKSLFIFRESND